MSMKRFVFFILPCAAVVFCSIMGIRSSVQIVPLITRHLQSMSDSEYEIELENDITRKLRRADISGSFSESVRALKGEALTYARIRPYPTGNVDVDTAAIKDPNSTKGWVLIVSHFSAMRIVHDLHNLEDAHCRRCLMAIHTGTSCSSPQLVGNETYYDHDRFDEDPWLKKGLYLAFNHKSSVTRHAFTVTNGYKKEENTGHVLVIYNKAGNPTACGELIEPNAAWYKDWKLVPSESVTD